MAVGAVGVAALVALSRSREPVPVPEIGDGGSSTSSGPVAGDPTPGVGAATATPSVAPTPTPVPSGPALVPPAGVEADPFRGLIRSPGANDAIVHFGDPTLVLRELRKELRAYGGIPYGLVEDAGPLPNPGLNHGCYMAVLVEQPLGESYDRRTVFELNEIPLSAQGIPSADGQSVAYVGLAPINARTANDYLVDAGHYTLTHAPSDGPTGSPLNGRPAGFENVPGDNLTLRNGVLRSGDYNACVPDALG